MYAVSIPQFASVALLIYVLFSPVLIFLFQVLVLSLLGLRCHIVVALCHSLSELAETGWVCWSWLGLVGSGWSWLGLARSGWSWLGLAAVGWDWLGLAVVGWDWLGLAGVGWVWLQLAGAGWDWLSLNQLNGNGFWVSI